MIPFDFVCSEIEQKLAFIKSGENNVIFAKNEIVILFLQNLLANKIIGYDSFYNVSRVKISKEDITPSSILSKLTRTFLYNSIGSFFVKNEYLYEEIKQSREIAFYTVIPTTYHYILALEIAIEDILAGSKGFIEATIEIGDNILDHDDNGRISSYISIMSTLTTNSYSNNLIRIHRYRTKLYIRTILLLLTYSEEEISSFLGKLESSHFFKTLMKIIPSITKNLKPFLGAKYEKISKLF